MAQESDVSAMRELMDVTVIGLGKMGFGLASALLEHDCRVTVWNRTIGKAAPLAERGATSAVSVSDAVLASSIVIVCVADYDVADEILEQAREHIAGRLVVQMTVGTPSQARRSELWANQNGAQFVDAFIMSSPEAVGSQRATIYVSGVPLARQRAQSVLEILAGNVVDKGPKAGRAAAWSCLFVAEMTGSLLGLFHAVQICQAEGISIDEYGGSVLPSDWRMLLKRTASNIKNNEYRNTSGTLQAYATAIELLRRHASESGIDTSFPALSSSFFQSAIAEGFGDMDVAKLIDVLGPRKTIPKGP